MLPLIAPMLAAAAIGAGAACWRRELAERAAGAGLRLLLYGLMPLVVLANVHRVALTPGVVSGIAIAYLVIATVALLAWASARRLALSRPMTGATIATSISANSGYLGIPLAHALLGERAVPAAILYDLVVGQPTLYVGVFGIAATMGDAAGGGLRAGAGAYLRRNVAIPAALAGALLPALRLDGTFAAVSHVTVPLLAPIGFFAVGATLAAGWRAARPARGGSVRSAVATAVALRMVAAPSLMMALGGVLSGVPAAFMMEAAMPSGMASLAVAHAYGLDRVIVVRAIAATTAVLLLGLVMRAVVA